MADSGEMRAKLSGLRTLAEEMLKQLGVSEAGGGAEAWGLLEQFTSAVDGIIMRAETSDSLAFVKRFFDILPPESIKADIDRLKETLQNRLQSQEPRSDIARPYELFVRLADKPDLELSQEELDAVEEFFGMRLMRPLYRGKYSFAPSAPPVVPATGEDRILPEEHENILEETVGSEAEAESVASEAEKLEPQDNLPPEEIEPEEPEPEPPNLDEILPRFEVSTQKSGSDFSVKAFTSEFFLIGARSGSRIPKPERYGELKMICWFADMGAFTKQQLEEYLFCDDIGNIQIEKLCRGGYVSVIKHKASGMEFYALSAKGADIFKKTSRNLMKPLVNPIPSPPLNYETEIPQIDADIDAYRHTATVALRFDDNTAVRSAERIHADPEIPIVLLRLGAEGMRVYIILIEMSRKVLLLPIPAAELPSSPAERKSGLRHIARQVRSGECDYKSHYCTVSDDKAAVNCFDHEGNGIDIDEYIERRIKPAAEEISEKQLLDSINSAEFADIIGLLTAKTGNPLELKEFAKRLKKYNPGDDKSAGFKEFVKRLKQSPPESSKVRVFKDFIDGIHQKIISEESSDGIGLKACLESQKREKSPAGAAEPPVGADVPVPTGGTETETASVAEHANPFDMARGLLDKKDAALPGREAFDALISSLLGAAADASQNEDATDYIGRAAVLLKALSLADAEMYDADYHRLLLAVDMPLDDRSYSTEELSTYFPDENAGTAFHLASLLRALFLPASQYDYSLTDYARDLFKRYDRMFPVYYELKGTLDVFIDIAAVSHGGFTDEVISRFIDEDSKGKFLRGLSSSAAVLREVPHINQRFNGVPEMLERCFGQGSELGRCVSHIVENQKSGRDFVLGVYESFVENGKASPQKIDAFIDENWREVRNTSDKWIRNDDILSTARQKVNHAIRQRLEIMNRWLAYADTSSGKRDNALNVMYSKTKKSLEIADKFLRGDASLPKPDRAVLFRAVKNLHLRISGKHPLSFLPEDWLSAGIFAVSDGRPRVSGDYGDVLYYEPWRNALRHIAEKPAGNLRDTLAKIENPEDPLYDNLGQAVAICECLGIDKSPYQNSVKNAREGAEKHLILAFKERLALDCAYARIEDLSKEAALADLERMKPDFFERSDFAGLRHFITVLGERLNDGIAEKLKYWQAAILERKRGGTPDKHGLLERATRQMSNIENVNFILVEELLNLFDLFDGKAGLGQGNPDFSEEDLFSEFIAGNNYGYLETFYKRGQAGAAGTIQNFAEKFVKARIKDIGKHKDSALRLLHNFPDSPEKDGEEEISAMLAELGFAVLTVKRENPNRSPADFTVKVTPDGKSAESHRHPVAVMGTKMSDTLRVVELFGNMEPRAIIEAVPKQDSEAGRMPIVLLNGFLTLAQRRQLARLFLKDGNAQNPFVLVDWILLLHLAQRSKDDRIRIMLACAMPYTGCRQLFSENDKESVADEMFAGRAEEIRQITDKNGPVFIYGGPRMGKTALLRRAENMFHAPKNGDYGVYVDAKYCRDENLFAAALAGELKKADSDFAPTRTTINALCDEIKNRFDSNGKRLLLLIDNADDILTALAANGYAALNDFERLNREVKRFKFIFAARHNVFLAGKDADTVLGRFGKPICVRPLSQADAYRLLARPLRCLGFDVNADTLLPLLMNTNFYPGVVHLVGAELVKMLIRGYANHYNESDNPPYQLDNRHIGSVMRSVGLSGTIEDGIRRILEDDADTKYIMLARCVAALYYEDAQNRSVGYGIDRIMEYVALLGIDALRDETEERCENLLSEMCDMCVLLNADGRYRFRQARFLNIIGKSIGDIIEQIAREQEAGNG